MDNQNGKSNGEAAPKKQLTPAEQKQAMEQAVRVAVAVDPEYTRLNMAAMAAIERQMQTAGDDKLLRIKLTQQWKEKWEGILRVANEAADAVEQMADGTTRVDLDTWNDDTFRSVTSPAIQANKEKAMPLVNQLRMVRTAMESDPNHVGMRVKLRELCDQLDKIAKEKTPDATA